MGGGGVSAKVPGVHRGVDTVTFSLRKSQQDVFSGFQVMHFLR